MTPDERLDMARRFLSHHKTIASASHDPNFLLHINALGYRLHSDAEKESDRYTGKVLWWIEDKNAKTNPRIRLNTFADLSNFFE